MDLERLIEELSSRGYRYPRGDTRADSPYEHLNHFPHSSGILLDNHEIKYLVGVDWTAERIKDYYLHFDCANQVLLLVENGIGLQDFDFWSKLKAFVLADQIYVVEREKIGLFPFNPKNVIWISVKDPIREYAVVGLRHCRLVSENEARFKLSGLISHYLFPNPLLRIH